MLLSPHEKQLLITGYVRAIANVANDYRAPQVQDVEGLVGRVMDVVVNELVSVRVIKAYDASQPTDPADVVIGPTFHPA